MRTSLVIGLGLFGLLAAQRARAELPTAINSTGGEPDVTPTGIPEAQQTPADTKGPLGVDWSAMRFFKPHEFRGATIPGGPVVDLLPLLDAKVILAADELRARLGRALQVSPVDGACVRIYGSETSRHYAGDGRLSDALDLFIVGQVPSDPAAAERVRADLLREAFEAAQQIPLIGGIGLYPHTRPHPLIHIDTRPRGFGGQVATWARDTLGHYVAASYALNRGLA